MNTVCLIGNLTRDPELRHTPAGHAVCSMRIAVNDRQKDSSGEWQDRPYYFDVTCWGNLGERVAQYMAKGRKVGVQGKLTWREWEAQDGTKRQAVEINAFSVDFLDKPKDGDGQQQRRQQEDDFAPAGVGGSVEYGEGGDFVPASNSGDDDIPF